MTLVSTFDLVLRSDSVRRLCTKGMHALAAMLLVGLLASCDSPEERLQDHYESGMELLEQDSFDKASLEFRNALQINSDHIPSIYALSQIEERRANWHIFL